MERSELVNLLTGNIGMKKEGTDKQLPSGASQLSRDIRVNQKVVWWYIQCLYLEKATQAHIGRSNGEILYTWAGEITKLYPDYPSAQALVERLLRDGSIIKREDLRAYVFDVTTTAEEEVEKEAKKIEKKAKATVEKENLLIRIDTTYN